MAISENRKVKIGFVPAHREFFSEEWAVSMRKRTIDVLSSIPDIELIVPDNTVTKNGLVRNEDDAERTIELFKKEKIAGLIIGTMTFGEEIPSISIAEEFKGNPILIFGTKEGSFTADGNRLSDSFCGTISLSSGLYRRKIQFQFAGIVFPEEGKFLKSVKTFAQVCSICEGFLGARIGVVGPRPEPFETCIYNENAMINQFNQRLIPISLAFIFDYANKISNESPEVKKIIEEIKNTSDISEINENVLLKMAKLEISLRHFTEQKKTSSLAIQCWTDMQEIFGICSCHVMGRLTESGIMSSCEVDVYGALTMLIQYLATMRKTFPHFVDWTIQKQEDDNVFLAWHCGNAPPSLVCEGCKIHIRSHSILEYTMSKENLGGTAEFQLKPGIITLSRLVEYDGKFKILITSGEIKKSKQNLRGSWSWVKVPDLKKLYRVIVEQGFIHHVSLIHGDYVEAIVEACKFLGIEPIVV